MAKVRPRGAPDDPSLCMKYTLFFINIIFWLVAAVILAVGIYMMIETKVEFQKLADISFQPAILFLFFGGLLFIITFLGCLGALRENTGLLCVYIGLVTLVLMVMIAAAALAYYFKDTVEVTVTKKLKEAIVLYRDPDHGDLHLIIDNVQKELKCCGVSGYNDWDANMYFNCSGKAHERCGVPYTCCVNQGSGNSIVNTQCGYGIRDSGVSVIDADKVVYTEGCVKRGIAWLNENLILIGGISAGVLVLQLTTLCLARMFRSQVQEVKEFASRH